MSGLPDYINREWLDRHHPVSDDTTEVVGGVTLGPIQRCHTCEEWSPCRVRTLFEYAARPAPSALVEAREQIAALVDSCVLPQAEGQYIGAKAALEIVDRALAAQLPAEDRAMDGVG